MGFQLKEVFVDESLFMEQKLGYQNKFMADEDAEFIASADTVCKILSFLLFMNEFLLMEHS